MPSISNYKSKLDFFCTRVNATWLVVVLVITLIHLSTIRTAPYLHLDEFMIIDLGRTILNPHTNWSIAWMTSMNQPVFIWFYLGAITQETIYQYAGEFGPRLFSLAGALVAAFTMFKWLLLRGTEQIPACILSIAFLSDPLFVQSFSMGRLDSWTMACCIAACAVLQNIRRINNQRTFHIHIWLAGAIVMIAFLIWPSAIFLIPLIFIELFQVASQRAQFPANVIKITAYFVLSILLTGLIMTLPISKILTSQLINILNSFATNTRSGTGPQLLSYYPLEQAKEAARIIKYTPVLFFLTLIASLGWLRKELIIGLCIAFLIMVFTVVYIHRIQYLLPYFFVIISEIYRRREPAEKQSALKKSLKNTGLIALLSWGIGISVVGRALLANNNNSLRDRKLVYDAAASMIGTGNFTVFIPGEFYYPGRILGWRMYKPYLAQNEPLSYETFRKVLPYVNYVIWTGKSAPIGFQQELLRNGMSYKKSYQVTGHLKEKQESIFFTRMRSFFSIQLRPYDTYTLYARN